MVIVIQFKDFLVFTRRKKFKKQSQGERVIEDTARHGVSGAVVIRAQKVQKEEYHLCDKPKQ
jgi:hypothetical protein